MKRCAVETQTDSTQLKDNDAVKPSVRNVWGSQLFMLPTNSVTLTCEIPGGVMLASGLVGVCNRSFSWKHSDLTLAHVAAGDPALAWERLRVN